MLVRPLLVYDHLDIYLTVVIFVIFHVVVVILCVCNFDQIKMYPVKCTLTDVVNN